MNETKIFSGGGLDSNLTVEAVGTNDYLDAEFIRTLVTDGNDAGLVNSVDGTILIDNPNRSTTDILVNAKYFKDLGKVVLFYRGEQDRIDLFDPTDNSYEVLVDGTGFGLDDVKDIKLVDSKLLIWNNGKSEIKCINIERAPYVVTRPDAITLYKNSPSTDPRVHYIDNGSIDINNLRGNLFQFRTQFVYEDNQLSAWSPISDRPVPENEGNPDIIKDNSLYNSIVIESVIPESEYDIKRVRTAMRVGNGDWYIIDDIEVTDIEDLDYSFLDESASTGVTRSFDSNTRTYGLVFSNNGLYEHVDVFETDLLHDHLPRQASAIEVINKNVVAIAGGKEGYERPQMETPDFFSTSIFVDPPTPPEYNRLFVTSLHHEETSNEIDAVIQFGGLDPIAGDKIEVWLLKKWPNHPTGTLKKFDYTFTSGDIALGRGGALNAAFEAIVLESGGSWTISTEMSSTDPTNTVHLYCTKVITGLQYNVHVNYVGVVPAGDIAGKISVASLKTNSSYQLALAHYDEKGRAFPIVTNSDWIVNTVGKDFYSSVPAGKTAIPIIVATIPPGTQAPDGAASYQWLISENTKFQNWVDVEAEYFDADNTGGDTLTFDLTEWFAFLESDGANQVTYEFSEGDRAILYKEGGVNYMNVDLDVKSLENVEGEWKLKVSKPSDETFTEGTDYKLEIYTPKRNTIDDSSVVFWSLPPVYPVVDGEYSQTNYNIMEADNYLKVRNGEVVEDPSFSDYYPSKYYDFGMPRTYYDTPEGVTYEARIRYSREYIFGSQINGINRFYPESFRDYDYTFGKIQYLTSRANRLVCVQQRNTGYIGVYRNILETAEAQASVAYTTEFLSDCSYTTGLPTGIGDAVKSYVEYNTIVYFVDPYRETIVRAGLDGIMDIGRKYSDKLTHLIRSEKEAGAVGDIVGMYNTDTNDVLFYLPTDGSTYVYAEEIDQWVCRLPIGEVTTGFSTDRTFYLSQDGDVWQVSEQADKASYFGTQYLPNITFPVNQNSNFVKSYQSLAVHCDQVLETGPDGITTQLGHVSDLLAEDFVTREGVNYANFWRDKNTDLISGDRLKGRWIILKLQATPGNPDFNLLKVVVKSVTSTPNE